jgi:hypothetical protein
MTSSKITLHIIISLVVLLGGAAIAGAQTPIVYVSALGSDGNTGGRTTPVQTIGRAISLVQAGGEVAVLDSGDYKEFTVNKSATIEAAPGVIAVIPVTNNSTGIVVDPGSSGTAVLRGLTITTPGGGTTTMGIVCKSGAVLIENCVVNGGFNTGIEAYCARLFVKDTAVIGCAVEGIDTYSNASTPLIATIERCRLEKNDTGLDVLHNSIVTVRDTVASGNNVGMDALGEYNGQTSELNVERCLLSGNNIGISSSLTNPPGGTVIVRASDSIATDNNTGLYAASGTTFYTRGNNKIGGNAAADVAGVLTLLTAY